MEMEKARKRQRDLKAYDIAKQIADFAETNLEAMDVINQVKNIFNWYYQKQKPEIFPYPIDSAGRKMEMSGAEAPDNME